MTKFKLKRLACFVAACFTMVVVTAPAAVTFADELSNDDQEDAEDAGDKFQELNAEADEAAEGGDFQQAINLWRQAIPYDQSPYVECRGALQRVYIRVAEHVITMMNNDSLDEGEAFSWFKARVSNVWGNSGCDSP